MTSPSSLTEDHAQSDSQGAPPQPLPEHVPQAAEAAAAPASEAHAAPTTGAAPEGGGGEPSEGTKRRVRLNPTFDPQRVRPIPSLAGQEPPPTATPAGPISSASDASIEAPASGEIEASPAVDDSAVTRADEAPATEPSTMEFSAAPPVELPGQQELDAQMEAEIAAALQSGEIGVPQAAEAAAAPEATGESAPPPTLETVSPGTKVTGTIQSVHDDNVFVDFGWRLSGLVSLRQFSPQKPPKVGDRVEVIVEKVDEEEGLISCRLPRGTSRHSGDWHALTPGQIVDCLVTKTNKGGLEVTVGSLRGFLPASQVELGYVADLQPFVGQKLRVRVTEVNPARRRLVVSRRTLLQEERAAAEQELLTQLEAGQTRSGRVKTIKEYGAFIDLGGIDGFLHIGQMSWVRINHPSEVLSEGQEVEVKILSIDSEKKKISLGMRQLSANPWASADTKYAKGTTVTGRVTRTEAFGAFVELEPGVEGLVHISELDYKRVRSVTDVLKVGQMTDVQVLEVDPQKKRVSLSVKALKAKPEEPAAPAAEPPEQAPQRARKTPLKGGIGGNVRGGLFGDPRNFG